MKKRIALLLSLVLVLALCACGGEKPTVIGTWKADINMADAFNQEMEAAGMGEYINLDSFNLPLVLELKEDGTGSMTVDKDGMNATMDKLAEELTAGMTAFYSDYFESMGLEIDLEEALAQSGMSLEDLVTEMKNQFVSEEAFEEFTSEFKYKAEDGKLYMSDDLESEITEEYNDYTLDGDTLTLDVGNMTDEEMAEYLFPMTLKRAK